MTSDTNWSEWHEKEMISAAEFSIEMMVRGGLKVSKCWNGFQRKPQLGDEITKGSTALVPSNIDAKEEISANASFPPSPPPTYNEMVRS